jgi:hypothetical protein
MFARLAISGSVTNAERKKKKKKKKKKYNNYLHMEGNQRFIPSSPRDSSTTSTISSKQGCRSRASWLAYEKKKLLIPQKKKKKNKEKNLGQSPYIFLEGLNDLLLLLLRGFGRRMLKVLLVKDLHKQTTIN